jgi:hypothetical protein
MASEYRLQPLRVPTGWTVTWNGGLYEVEPDPSAGVEDLFGEDLLQMRHNGRNRVLDVGWYPTRDLVNGSYGLVVYEGDFHGRMLFEFRTRDRRKLVGEVDRLLDEIAEGRL